jgi:hypothetical protein
MYLCRCVSRHTQAPWFSLWVLHAFEPLESVWTKFSSDHLICLSRWSLTLMIEPKYKYFQQKIKRVIEWQRPLSCTKGHQRAFGEILMDIGNKYKRESSIVFTFFFSFFFWLIVCFCFFFGLCLLVFSFALYFWWMGYHPWFLYTGFFFFYWKPDMT